MATPLDSSSVIRYDDLGEVFEGIQKIMGKM